MASLIKIAAITAGVTSGLHLDTESVTVIQPCKENPYNENRMAYYVNGVPMEYFDNYTECENTR